MTLTSAAHISASSLIAEGIAALKANDHAQAATLLSAAIALEPKNEQGWLWLSGAVATDGERRYCLEQVLSFNPSSPSALRGLARLASGTVTQAPSSFALHTQALLPTTVPTSNAIQQELRGAAEVRPVNDALHQLSSPPTPVAAQSPATVESAAPIPQNRPAVAPSIPQLRVTPRKKNWLGVILAALVGTGLYIGLIATFMPSNLPFAIIVAATSIWVLIDTTSIGVRRGQLRGVADMSSEGWFGACLLLWLIAFPLYLVKRGELAAINRQGAPTPNSAISAANATATVSATLIQHTPTNEPHPRQTNPIPTAQQTDLPLLLGLFGSLLLIIGVFLPLVSLPFVGTVTYIMNGQGDGIIILILAATGLLFTLARKFGALWGAGLGSLGVMAYTFLRLQSIISEMRSSMQRGLAGNPFSGLADAALQSIQLQWGWAVLLVGAMLVLAAAATAPKPLRR